MSTDPIADMLTRIRNASMVNHRQVALPASKIKVAIAQILKAEGFISDFAVTDEKPQPNLVMRLKYTGRGDAVITGVDRVSKPGKRVYTNHRDIPWVRAGLGITIVSTPKGLMTGREARKAKLGGEIICNVW
ncbi:MAG: 30S ribosomal protein S8 [Caldilineaceae bacterium]|nr:30S ribosomal protein S8 [Caldilineaceae bacterium]